MFSFVKIFFIFIIFFLSACHEKNYDVLKLIIQDKKEENLKKADSVESKEDNKNNLKKTDKKTVNLEKKKENITSKVENKKLEQRKKSSRVLESFKKNKVKNIETERNSKKLKEKKNSLQDKIKIGVMLPLSGDNSEIGHLILNAIEMAIFQTKENKLEFYIKDTEAKTDKTKIVLNELIDEGVKIVIGPLFSKSLAAVQNIAARNNINIFALTNNINLKNQGIWIFGVDPQAQTEKILQYALENGSKNIAALLPQNAYGLLLFDTISSFSKENMMKIEKIEFYDFSIDNQRKTAQKLSAGFEEYQAYLDQVKELETEEAERNDNFFKEKPFDSVFIAASGQNLKVLSSQLQYNNVDPKTVQYLGISSWEDNSILSEPALEGGVFVTTSEMYQKKIKLIYKSSFSKEMPKIAMIAYDIVALLGALDDLENNINDLINDEGYIGLRGLFRLKNNGEVERTFQLKKIKNKKFTILKKASNQFTGL